MDTVKETKETPSCRYWKWKRNKKRTEINRLVQKHE